MEIEIDLQLPSPPKLIQFVTSYRSDLDLAGGKGANPGDLLCAGFPVPDGFVATVHAYAHHLAPRGLPKTFAQHRARLQRASENLNREVPRHRIGGDSRSATALLSARFRRIPCALPFLVD